MSTRRLFSAVAVAVIGCSSMPGFAQDTGRFVYEKTCALCHGAGVAGAPRLGFADEWRSRLAAGKAKLYTSALKGTAAGMPMKGGNLSLSDADVRAAVDFMASAVAGAAVTAPVAPREDIASAKKPTTRERANAPPPIPAKRVAASASSPEAVVSSPAPAAPAIAAAPQTKDSESPVSPLPAVPTATTAASDPNSFNRLLAAPGLRNPPPALDGIHDPENPGTLQLQHPGVAFSELPRTNAGNRVNWGQSTMQSKIQPRWDRDNPAAAAVVMDLNIVREVKGSMPDVVYPHKQHTEWLDCAACHPQIFIPQKGANQISMAAIMLGQKCGVCHGKVAFPVSECRLCHSKPKQTATVQQEKGAK